MLTECADTCPEYDQISEVFDAQERRSDAVKAETFRSLDEATKKLARVVFAYISENTTPHNNSMCYTFTSLKKEGSYTERYVLIPGHNYVRCLSPEEVDSLKIDAMIGVYRFNPCDFDLDAAYERTKEVHRSLCQPPRPRSKRSD